LKNGRNNYHKLFIENQGDKMKKIDIAKQTIKSNENIFMCPKCKGAMTFNDNKTLACESNHCFDIAKPGYLNLLLGASNIHYDKTLLESRNVVCNEGIFNPMIQKVSEIVESYFNDQEKSIMLLDAGCGEGSHLESVLSILRNGSEKEYRGVGIDISKDAIKIAAREYIDNIWAVADLANCPFKSDQFDVILNILSPSNYGEFDRILNPKGILIKVVPDHNYLAELRRHFYADTDKEEYSNEKVVTLYEENYEVVDRQNLSYEVQLDRSTLEHLIRMTPLSWGIAEEKIQEVLDTGLRSITMAFCILVGKKTGK